jgi:uncharacterized membrane protein
MKTAFIGICTLLLITNFAMAATLEADFSLSANDIVTESVTATFDAAESYDSFVFTAYSEPLSIIYDGKYSLQEQDGYYVISFAKDITPGQNTVSFQLLYDSLVEKSGSSMSFRTAIYSEIADNMIVSVTLPSGYALSEHLPSATPEPGSITSDGRRITLHWDFDGTENAIAVFYTGGSNFSLWWLALGAAVIAIAGIAFFVFHKRRLRRIVSETLSEDEQNVIGLLRQGTNKQKEIAQKLEFSKSKMSKVIRRLEEKGLVEKSPFFKTNIVKLKKI